MKSTGKVTVKDIAKHMGVSLSTVNKALTGKRGVSEKRRAEVIAVARDMGYVVNHVAQSLSRKPMRIGIIIPTGWKQYFGLIENGMEAELERLAQSNVNGEIFHVSSSDDIKNAFDRFTESDHDIIIYCPSLLELDRQTVDMVNESGKPVMLVGADCSELNGVCTVSIDTALSGRMAAEMLGLLLSNGDEAAIFIGSKLLDTHIEKTNAFIERAKELGLRVACVCETNDDDAVASEYAAKLCLEHPNVKGIYVATGSVTPIVQHFREKKLHERIHIIATDIDCDVRKAMANGDISATIFQNQMLMGRLAIERAYRYLVEKSSFCTTPSVFERRINVTPHLFLKSDLDAHKVDDGNDYTVG